MSILTDAYTAVNGARNDDYGDPADDFARISALWTILLGNRLAEGQTVTPGDVARCMVALKLARDVHNAKRDNRVDIAGYAHCLEHVEPSDG